MYTGTFEAQRAAITILIHISLSYVVSNWAYSYSFMKCFVTESFRLVRGICLWVLVSHISTTNTCFMILSVGSPRTSHSGFRIVYTGPLIVLNIFPPDTIRPWRFSFVVARVSRPYTSGLSSILATDVWTDGSVDCRRVAFVLPIRANPCFTCSYRSCIYSARRSNRRGRGRYRISGFVDKRRVPDTRTRRRRS